MSEDVPQTPFDDAVDGASADAASPSQGNGPAHPAWLPFAIDFGPLLAFFITFKLTKSDAAFGATAGAIKATGVFMIAILIALFISQWKLKKISPMLWLSAVLVIGFGALTLYFHDERFIQMKPTIIYAGFAALLLGGWARGRPLIKYLLQSAFDGLTHKGWMLLSRNWGLFFLAMAVLNEGVRATLDFDAWLTVKVWGAPALTFLFIFLQMPVMLHNGLNVDADESA